MIIYGCREKDMLDLEEIKILSILIDPKAILDIYGGFLKWLSYCEKEPLASRGMIIQVS
jgi:hypothetical protein